MVRAVGAPDGAVAPRLFGVLGGSFNGMLDAAFDGSFDAEVVGSGPRSVAPGPGRAAVLGALEKLGVLGKLGRGDWDWAGVVVTGWGVGVGTGAAGTLVVCGPGASGRTGAGPSAGPEGHRATVIARAAITAPAPAPAVVAARTRRRRAARRRIRWNVPGGGARTEIPGRSTTSRSSSVMAPEVSSVMPSPSWARSSSPSSSGGSMSVIKMSSESGAQEFPCRV